MNLYHTRELQRKFPHLQMTDVERINHQITNNIKKIRHGLKTADDKINEIWIKSGLKR